MMTKPPIKNIFHVLAIVLLSLLNTTCSDHNESSLEISTSNSCVFPGRLSLDATTQERLNWGDDSQMILGQYGE